MLITEVEIALFTTVAGVFGVCYGLLRVLKQVVERRWPSDLLRGARIPVRREAPATIARAAVEDHGAPEPAAVEVSAAVAREIAQEAVQASSDVAAPPAQG
jgi:hypothetical protein